MLVFVRYVKSYFAPDRLLIKLKFLGLQTAQISLTTILSGNFQCDLFLLMRDESYNHISVLYVSWTVGM